MNWLGNFEVYAGDLKPGMQSIDPQTCPHSNLVAGQCVLCGRKFDTTYDVRVEFVQRDRDVQPVKAHNADIFSDLNFDEEIKDIARSIYENYPDKPARESKKRHKVAYFCVYSAYKTLNRPIISSMLNDLFKLTPKEAASAIKDGIKAMPKPIETKSYDLYELIPLYYSKVVGNSDNAKYAVEMAKTIINKDKSRTGRDSKLNTLNSFHIASAFVYYYLVTSGQNMTIKEFAQRIKISEQTVSINYNRISKIDNSENGCGSIDDQS